MYDPRAASVEPLPRPSWFYYFGGAMVRLLVPLIARLEVNGLEHVPRHGPLLVVSNHRSFVDPILLPAVFPRVIVFMAKIELWRHPIINWLVHQYRAFPVRRGESDTWAMARALQILEHGGAVGIFPEGHRTRTGGMIPAHAGAGLLALRSRAPVLPVALVSTELLYPPRPPWRRPHVAVRFGEPFLPADLLPERTPRRSERATELIMRRVAAMLPPEMRGVYAAPGNPPQPAAATATPQRSPGPE
jgi:1-acyl-sn-glycerol-3-phosphate acyltransferase